MNHVFNQSGKTIRSLEVLLDSQLTCDVIIKGARIAAAIRGKKAKKAEERGAGYFINSAIIPTFDEQIVIEDDHDGYDHDAYCHTSYQFMMLVSG